jgi:hypothetical protein
MLWRKASTSCGSKIDVAPSGSNGLEEKYMLEMEQSVAVRDANIAALSSVETAV